MEKLPLIIEPEQLARMLDTDNLRLVDLCNPQNYAEHHLPGAVHVHPSETQHGMAPAPGLLPSAERLQSLVKYLGLSPQTQVVVYDDEGGGWAGRFIWLLDCIGHQHYSLLNGGLIAWINEGYPVTRAMPELVLPKTAHPTEPYPITDQSQSFTITLPELVASLPDGRYNVWDARSPGEYRGERAMAMRSGHIPGAFNLEWTQAMDSNRNYRLKPLPQLRRVLQDCGLSEAKAVVTHCQTHHRSGLTYLIAKSLGYDVKAYAGSWSEWGNRTDTPIEA
jgi:thiosulfate/3-mercaptopyruvate sulfurtransferase